jgi:dihydroorotate dehydrogenase (fumarate)
MLTSELLEKGIGRLSEIKADLTDWLQAHDYQSLNELRGRLSQQNTTEPAAFERANYLKILTSLS